MKNLFTIVIVFFIAHVCFSQTTSPTVFNSAGGFARDGYYQLEWSIGEMSLVNQMKTPAGGTVLTHGFIQPYLIHPAYDNPAQQFGIDEIKIFPNPASRYLEINFFTNQKGQLQFNFFNAIGQKVYTEEMRLNGVDLIYRMPITTLSAGTYLLKIQLIADPGFDSKKSSYKIIKIE